MQGTISNSARVAWACALTLAIFVLWLVVPRPSNVGIAFFYCVPIGLTTWWFGRRAGAIAVLGCAVLYCIGALIEPVHAFGLAFAIRILAFTAVATLISLLRERQLALEHSAEELEAIRAALTPSALPRLAGVDAAATFVPSQYGVSGDFYLLTNGPDGSAVAIVGDVVGHGPKAARLATFVRARFAAFAAGTSDPAELLTLANDALLDRPSHERDLVSAACLRLRDNVLSWSVAGHPPPLHMSNLEELVPQGPTYLLGAEAGLVLGNQETPLPRGDGALIYTDGATDVRQDGARLGLAGLTRLLGPLIERPALEIATQMEKAILGWAGEPIRDDLCLLVLKSR